MMSTDRVDRIVYGYESECCGAPIIYHDICSECGEHCDAVEDEEDENLGGTGHGDISWSDADPGL